MRSPEASRCPLTPGTRTMAPRAHLLPLPRSVLGTLFGAGMSPDTRHGQGCAVEEAEEEEREQRDRGRPQVGSWRVLQRVWRQVLQLPV